MYNNIATINTNITNSENLKELKSKKGRNVWNQIFRKENGDCVLVLWNHRIGETYKHYILFDEEDLDIFEKYQWNIFFNNRKGEKVPYLVANVDYDSTAQKAIVKRFSNIFKEKYYKDAESITIFFKSENLFNYKKSNLDVKVYEKKLSEEKDLDIEEQLFLETYLKTHKNYIKLEEIIAKSDLTLYKKNIYFQINEKDGVLLILKYNNKNNIYNYKEVLFSLENLNDLLNYYWIYNLFLRSNNNFINIITNVYNRELKRKENLFCSSYLLNKIYPETKNKKVTVLFLNKNLLDLRKENLFYKNLIDKNDVETNIKREESEINSHFDRYYFKSLNEVPENWILIGNDFSNSNYHYKISDNEVIIMVRNYNKYIYNNFDRCLWVGVKVDLGVSYEILEEGKIISLRYTNQRPKYMIYASYKNTDLHRLICYKLHENDVIDHINRDTLDNRRCNLTVSMTENNRNLSLRSNTPYNNLGVYFQEGTWVSSRSIKIGEFENGKPRLRVRSCHCSTREEAIEVRKKLEKIPDEVFVSDINTAILLQKYHI